MCSFPFLGNSCCLSQAVLYSCAVHEYCLVNENIGDIFKENTCQEKKEKRGGGGEGCVDWPCIGVLVNILLSLRNETILSARIHTSVKSYLASTGRWFSRSKLENTTNKEQTSPFRNLFLIESKDSHSGR